jgi:hypothetical protein
LRTLAPVKWESVLAWRVERQQLAARAPRSAALDVVSRIGGLHAQVASCAELTLWARVDELEPGAVTELLWERRALVKTWAMRGTLHLLAAAELPLYVAALSRLRPRHHVPAWLRAHGLDRDRAEAMLAAIAAVLADRVLTREELAAAVAERVGASELAGRLKGGFGDLLKPAAFTGDLCFAASDGRLVRFARPADWLGGWKPVDPEQASIEVVRRYLRAYGPAPREQFQRWFGMTSPAEAGRWLTALGDEVAEVDVEGSRGWMLAADVSEAERAVPSEVVRLLGGFDQYVVAAPRDADAVLPAPLRERVYRPQGWLSPVLLHDGRIAGVWNHELKGGRLTVEVEPFARVGAGERAGVEREAERLARFLGGALALRWARATAQR